MYGFYIYINQNQEITSSNLSVVDEHIEFDTISFGHKKFDKFSEDKLFDQNPKYIVGLDGVIFNKKQLLKQYASGDFFSLLISLFEKENIQFAAKLKGVFSGFVFNKETQSLYFFNDKVATKQVFYSKFKNNLVIAPTVESIVQAREEVGVKNNLNIKATYNMLTFGGMIENQTLVKDVYKLGAGEYLKHKDNKIEVKRYFDFNEIDISISDKKKAIERLDETFIEALKLEYEKDIEYGYDHIATLSGGLDSRMNVMLANKLGYKPTTFCFSQSNYADETIARQIAKDLTLDFKFIPLDGGDFLKNLNTMVSINNGLQFYHGSAHYNYALQQLDKTQYGLMHTGQIGDGILGGFVSKGQNDSFNLKTVTERFKDKVQIKKAIVNSYRDEETFKLYQRVFNLANFGSYVVEYNQTYLASPFLDDDVIKIALSIHPKLKYNQAIYIDWINKLHPEITNYKWERTGFKPNKKWKTAFSRYTNKLKKEYLLFTNQQDKLSMNPLDYWYTSNNTIKEFYELFFKENIHLLQNEKGLYADVSQMFLTGGFIEKAIVLTLLEDIRKFKLNA